MSKEIKKGIAETLDAYEGLKDEIYLFELLSVVQELVFNYTSENTVSNEN